MSRRRIHLDHLLLPALVLAAGSGHAVLADEPTSRPTTAPSTQPALRPTTRPAEEDVLVRVGDITWVTQEAFERAMLRINERNRPAKVDDVVAALVEHELFMLYLMDHPDVATMQDVLAEREERLKQGKALTIEQLTAELAKKGLTLTEYREERLFKIGKNRLFIEGDKVARDLEHLEKLYNANPDHWNDTRLMVRHIFTYVPPYATPEQLDAGRKKLAAMREDLVSGRRTWEECVRESEDQSTRGKGGLIGPMPRYMALTEPVAAAAWKLQEGEISSVVRSHLGWHIVEVMGRAQGKRAFDDPLTRVKMQGYLRQQPFIDAIREARRKHPPVGVRAPDTSRVLPPETQPAPSEAATRAVTTQPAGRGS